MKLRRISSLILVLVLALSMTVTAFAADSTITYTGRDKFEFDVASTEFTLTDLFDEFKNVMPGDTRKETITISNKSKSCDYILVYLRAELHDADNPMHDTVKEKAGTLEKMNAFLDYMNLVVKQGNTEIFNGSPRELDGLKEEKYLGKLYRNKSLTLDAELTVSMALPNEFADFAGEVDWVLKVAEYNDPDAPKTGDETRILPYILLLAVGVTGMAVLLVGKRKRQN